MRVSVCRGRRGLAAAVVLGALALTASVVPGAEAAVSAPGVCDSAPLSQPFLAWGDTNSYKLAPGGDFEGSLAGWTLTGAAARVAGSATATLGSASLALPSGASAKSPSTCVNASYPSLRFFDRSDRPGSLLAVAVVYRTLLGDTAIPVGFVSPGAAWAPSAAMPTLSAIAVLTGGTASVQVRFTQVSGSSQIDNVLIDPHTMH
jgi:hypothetical protein